MQKRLKVASPYPTVVLLEDMPDQNLERGMDAAIAEHNDDKSDDEAE